MGCTVMRNSVHMDRLEGWGALCWDRPEDGYAVRTNSIPGPIFEQDDVTATLVKPEEVPTPIVLSLYHRYLLSFCHNRPLLIGYCLRSRFQLMTGL